MRALLAIAAILGGMLALNAAADAARKHPATQHGHAAPSRASPKAQTECERARHEDPTESFAAYPCWAREAFARGSQGNRQ